MSAIENPSKIKISENGLTDINLNDNGKKLHSNENTSMSNAIAYDDKMNDKSEWNLEEGIELVQHVVRIFFNNRFKEAKDICQRHVDKSIYHSLGLSYINFVYAVFTMESDLINEAVVSVDTSIEMVSKLRKASSITKSLSSLFFKRNYDDYTDEECHAEVIYGELQFMSFILTMINDPGFLAVIKGGLKLRTVYNTYANNFSIMMEKKNWKSKILKENYYCGTKLGYGFINVFISHLPARVMKVLSFAGFSADRTIGLKHLHEITDSYQNFYRYKITTFLICFYSFYIEQFFGVGNCDLFWVKSITDAALKEYPNGAFDLFWSARTDQLKGKAHEAIDKFSKCISCQDEFIAMHNVCYWDMLWSYAITSNWKCALECASKLEQACNWSKATNMYQKACFSYMIMEDADDADMLDQVTEYMRQVPELKKKYAGRTIPPEKFAVTKAIKFLNQDTEMVLPAYELMYIWNIFGNSAENPEILTPFISKLNQKLEKYAILKNEKYFMPLLLKGVCLRNAKRGHEAIDCFIEILQNEERMTDAKYIPPQAAFELGMTYLDLHMYNDAKEWLESARDNYSGFLVESLVHLRIHGAMAQLKQLMNIKRRKSSGNNSRQSSIISFFKDDATKK